MDAQVTYMHTIKTFQDRWGFLSGRVLTYLNKALYSIPSIQNNNVNNLSWEKNPKNNQELALGLQTISRISVWRRQRKNN